MAPRMLSVDGGAWGYHINWVDFGKGRVAGHWTPRPRCNDLLRSRMQSGQTAVFRFTKLEYMSDPPDQFFGTVEFVDYESSAAAPERETP